MALLGVGTFASAGAAGTAMANHEQGNGNAPTRQWNQHVEAQDHDLTGVRDLEADRATVETLQTAARDADVLVWQDEDGNYHADNADTTLYNDTNFTEAVNTAIRSLTTDRTTKEKVVVACSGTMGPHEWDGDVLAIDIPSYTIVDFRGTIHVEDEGEALIRPVRALNAEEIEIPRLHVEGNFRSAVWFRSVSNVRLGHLDIRTPEDSIIEGTGGGVRIDGFAEGRGEDTIRSTDIHVGSAYIENTVGHAFETYAVDRLQLGQLIANNPNFAGCLLNDTTDSTVGAVVGKDVDVGGGYATFRVANGAHDVTCDQVVANGGARGLFGVSGCHDITVGEVNIRNTDAHGALIQDCQRYTIEGGVFKNCIGEAVRVDSRSSQRHAPAEGVNVSNVRIVDTQDEATQTYGINETGPETSSNRFINNDLRDAGTEANMSLFAPSTVVRNNMAGGVAHGTVTLTSGEAPAATVEGVTSNGAVTLDLRAKPRSAPGSAFGYDHHFEWTGEQWNLVIEWTTDPGEDVDLDYIVDRPQANIGIEAEEGGDGDSGSATPEDGGTYTLTSALNASDILVSVDGTPEDGSNVYMQTEGEEEYQQWTLTELDSGNWRIDVANTDADLVLAAADGGTETGTNLVIETWEDAAHQKWNVAESGQGYTLQPSHAELAADVWERDPEPGADIRHWELTGDPNQTFIFSSGGSGDGEESEESVDFDSSPGLVEGFEDGNIDGYNGATGDYSVNEDSPVAQGNYSLKGTGGEGSALVTTDLDRAPQPGTRFSAKMGYTFDAENVCFAFGTNDTIEPEGEDAFPFNFIRIWKSGTDDWRLQFWTKSGSQLVGNSIDTPSRGEFYEVVVDWGTDETLSFTLNGPDGSEIATHEVEVTADQVGVGGGVGTRGTGLLDDIRILEDNTGE
jgi:hypothetical protein